MMLDSFLDELVKVGALAQFARPLQSNSVGALVQRTLQKMMQKSADLAVASAPNTNPDPVPPSIKVEPDRVEGRLLQTTDTPGVVVPGQLGTVVGAKKPIDQAKFNHPWETDQV